MLEIDAGGTEEIDGDLNLHKKLALETGGDLLSKPKRIAVKWFLNVPIARSAGFAW